MRLIIPRKALKVNKMLNNHFVSFFNRFSNILETRHR